MRAFETSSSKSHAQVELERTQENINHNYNDKYLLGSLSRKTAVAQMDVRAMKEILDFDITGDGKYPNVIYI